MEFQSVSDAILRRLANFSQEGLEVMQAIVQMGRAMEAQTGRRHSHVIVNPRMLKIIFPEYDSGSISAVGGYTVLACASCPMDQFIFEENYKDAKKAIATLNWRRAVAESAMPKNAAPPEDPEPKRGEWAATVIDFETRERW